MFERNDVDGGVETCVTKRERGQVGDGVELAVIPGGVADSEVHADVALPLEMLGVAHLAGAGVQDACTIGKIARKLRDGIFDGRFKVEHVAAQKCGKAALQRWMIQAFLRASTMIVDPQPQAASMMVNGMDASVKPK